MIAKYFAVEFWDNSTNSELNNFLKKLLDNLIEQSPKVLFQLKAVSC